MKIKGTIRNLHLESNEFSDHVVDFEKWLRVFGFAGSIIYYSPAYLRSFLHFLEKCQITTIDRMSNNHIRDYMNFLSKGISKRTGRRFSQSYMLNHLNAIRLFSKYLQISSNQTLDASLRYSRELTDRRRW